MTESLGDKVRSLLLAGMRNSVVAKTVVVSRATVSYHARVLGLEKTAGQTGYRFNWTEIQKVYDSGVSLMECGRRFGFSHGAMYGAIKSGRLIKRRPHQLYITFEEYASMKTGRYGRAIRARLKEKIRREGAKEYKCEICENGGIWNGFVLTLRLDHIDGDRANHHPNNLRFLCPNCDSQQSTYSHRNIGRYKNKPPNGIHS